MNSVAENLRQLRNEIRVTAQECGRDPASIRILAVSKTFPPECIEEAAKAGQILFGENRVQEAQSKIPAVRCEGLIWHLVGHLQTNKARRAVDLFDVIQTIHSEKVANKISSYCGDLGKSMQVFVQVNVGEEPQKSGVPPSRLPEFVASVDTLPNLEVVGLMSIPPFHDDPEQTRPYFRLMASLLEVVNQDRSRPLTELSMGMSADFRVAIEEGATLVRVGTAIFGSRL